MGLAPAKGVRGVEPQNTAPTISVFSLDPNAFNGPTSLRFVFNNVEYMEATEAERSPQERPTLTRKRAKCSECRAQKISVREPGQG